MILGSLTKFCIPLTLCCIEFLKILLKITYFFTTHFLGPHQLPQQQEAVGPGEGLRPALQHGAGAGQGDVDRDAQDGQGQEEGQAGQQGQVHCQDVSARRLGHLGAEESDGDGGRCRWFLKSYRYESAPTYWQSCVPSPIV